MSKNQVFDAHSDAYEDWFVENKFVYQSELMAVKALIPQNGVGVEIGVGSGLFAEPLGIKEGCDPSPEMRAKAIVRGINALDGVAENLPYADSKFDFALMVTSICFVDDVKKSFQEAYRILKTGGCLLVAFVDKESKIGKMYLKHKNESVFYRDAEFYSTKELSQFLVESNFEISDIVQTVFGNIQQISDVQVIKSGFGQGSFVVIKAQKNG
jgi:ubiquinone/menaquinone biosynthesis C-methylase UbiE